MLPDTIQMCKLGKSECVITSGSLFLGLQDVSSIPLNFNLQINHVHLPNIFSQNIEIAYVSYLLSTSSYLMLFHTFHCSSRVRNGLTEHGTNKILMTNYCQLKISMFSTSFSYHIFYLTSLFVLNYTYTM